MDQDTKLAMEYIQNKNSAFHSIGPFMEHEIAEPVLDSANNKIFYCDGEKVIDNVNSEERKDKDLKEICEKLNNLATKIEENADLFAQLEFLIRNVPVQETKARDINLIVDNLRYISSQCKEHNVFLVHLVMTANTPLAFLGSVAQVLMTSFTVCNIVCDKNTAAVCSLFVQLSQDCGLDVYMLLTENPAQAARSSEEEINLDLIKGMESCGMAVVSEKCDIDSAIDAICNSTFRFPWNLRRVLVQESTYKKFIEIMSFKTKDNANSPNIEQYAKKCTNVHIQDKKLFLVDYAGVDPKDEYWQIIEVEAYRTNQELISLIKRYNPFCISLWVSNITDSNEIAFGVDIPIIWINDYGIFDGPQKASQAFYNAIITGYSSEIYKKRYNDVLDDMWKRRESWLKLNNIKKRREQIFGVIDKFLLKQGDKDLSRRFDSFRRKIDWTTEKFVEIDNGKKTCMGIDEPVSLMCLPCSFDDNNVIDFDFLKSLVLGTVIVLDNCKENELLKQFKEAGLLVLFVDTYEDDSRVGTAFMLYRTRVIWTSY